MDLIENNPFRVLGVKANASLSDRKQQTNLIAQYLKIGQSAKLDFDITPPLKPLERTKEIIDLQSGRVFSTEDKILHSLFWFVEANAIDKIALKHLTGSKDINKALSDFEKGCRGYIVSPDSYSAILNHSTLEIIAYTQHRDLRKLKNAIAHKFSIVSDSSSLRLLKELVASDGMNTDVEKIIDLAIPKLKGLLKELLPSENTDKLLLDIFKSNTKIYPSLRNGVIDALLKKINRLVDKPDTKSEKTLEGFDYPLMIIDSVSLGEHLLKKAKKPLREIEELLGKLDPVYTETINKVYTEINFCGVLPFNKFIKKLNQNTENYKSNESLIHTCDLSMIVKLYENAFRDLVGLEVPIKAVMSKNKLGIVKTNRDIQRESTPPRRPPPDNTGSCFIATATLGSYNHSQVVELRVFRDEWILAKSWGIDFVKWYYHYGAIAARFIEKSFVLKKLSYLFVVKPLVTLSRILKK